MTAKKTAALAEDITKPAAASKPAAKVAKVSAVPKPAAVSTEDEKPKRGRKPKVVAVAVAEPKKVAKPEVEDIDLSDLEADLEGEPEVEAEAEAGVEETTEVTPKAKPLRMKVSRAKERALMREFGLEETALTEEEAAKRRHELKTLIKMGKTRGFLTHQEINDHLPEKLVNEEILEAIISMLNDMGIAVYEQAPDAATLLIAVGGTATATEEEAEEAAEAAL